jgi:hypothetical protein
LIFLTEMILVEMLNGHHRWSGGSQSLCIQLSHLPSQRPSRRRKQALVASLTRPPLLLLLLQHLHLYHLVLLLPQRVEGAEVTVDNQEDEAKVIVVNVLNGMFVTTLLKGVLASCSAEVVAVMIR